MKHGVGWELNTQYAYSQHIDTQWNSDSSRKYDVARGRFLAWEITFTH